MTKYISQNGLEKFKDRFPSVVIEMLQERTQIVVTVQDILSVMRFLKEDHALSFDRLANLTAVDYKDNFTMIYHLFSRAYSLWVEVKVILPHENPQIESMTAIWIGADFEEREVYDLMGISFLHHPNLCRILMPDNYGAHPLRKDFKPLQPKMEGGILTWQ